MKIKCIGSVTGYHFNIPDAVNKENQHKAQQLSKKEIRRKVGQIEQELQAATHWGAVLLWYDTETKKFSIRDEGE